jgi:predicted nucleic acid-binding Zn ribbon protein
MGYKTKKCPKCGNEHNKRGEFCSRSCGNSRPLTKEQKKKIGKAKSAWLLSGNDDAEVAKHNFISKRENAPSEPVAPVKYNDALNTNQFVQDGDIWTEV